MCIRKDKRKNGGRKMATREKNIWILLVFLLAGLVIGGLLGKLAASVPWLWWLSYKQQFIFPLQKKLNCDKMEKFA